jgi:hypothetical protein
MIGLSVVHALVISGLLLFYGAWIFLTVLYGRPRKAAELSRYGVFGLLIPSYNFFAPDPAVHDYHILLRDYDERGNSGPWRDVAGFVGHRPWYSPIWNPQKLMKKALFDILMFLFEEIKEREQFTKRLNDKYRSFEYNAIELSLPYLLLLNFISNLPKDCFVRRRQFMVVRRCNVQRSTEILLISSVHNL